MIRAAGRCYQFQSSEGEDEAEEEESCDCLQDSRASEDERRRSLLDYLEELQCEPLRKAESNACGKLSHSKQAVRRSSALVKSRRSPAERSRYRPDSASPESACCQTPGGSILRGKTRAAETQTSRSQSRNSFFTYSRTKGSRNGGEISPVGIVSSGFCDRLTRRVTPAGQKSCRCFSNTGAISNSKISNGEEIVDYQVPVQLASSSHGLCDTRSESKTLVPTSSHVTIRICSQNSGSGINCDRFYERGYDSSGSEDSLKHLEERVRRGLRAMCCCDDNTKEELDDELASKPGRRASLDYFGSKRGEERRPAVGFNRSSDEASFQRFKDVLTETRRRRNSTLRSRCKKNVTKPRRTICEPDRPRRAVGKLPDVRDPFTCPAITLSALKYKEFINRCECIKKSMRNTKGISGWKGDSINLGDLRPDLPPLDHWSQYENGMRKVANEYRTLKSCVNLMEAEEEEEKPSCCCTEKSVTRTYPSGTEFTFRVKRAPKKEACEVFSEPGLVGGSKKTASTTKGRSVCFERKRSDDQPVKDLEERDLASIEAMRSREAELVRTLEKFCEKMKSMKSEFAKSSGCCQRDGRGRKRTGCGKLRAKKLLIFPPEGEDGPPLTLCKNSSSVNCRVKGDRDNGFRYHVVYIQRFVSSAWNPAEETHECCIDSG